MELFELALVRRKNKLEKLHFKVDYWVMIVSPLYSHKSIRGAVAVIRDMTEERQLG